MNTRRSQQVRLEIWILPVLSATLAVSLAREPQPQWTGLKIRTDIAGCAVDLDSAPLGQTGEGGVLEAPAIEPGDHYLHVHCPGWPEKVLLISPAAGEKLDLKFQEAEEAAFPPLEPAEAKIQLRRHIQEAVQLRARGQVEDAVEHLRKARKLDPENADLHRELGITFLLAKDWKRARVEMLEAVRHSPDSADAHRGLGYALEKLGDFEGAVEAYRSAMRLEPEEPSHRQHYFGALAKLVAARAEKKK